MRLMTTARLATAALFLSLPLLACGGGESLAHGAAFADGPLFEDFDLAPRVSGRDALDFVGHGAEHDSGSVPG